MKMNTLSHLVLLLVLLVFPFSDSFALSAAEHLNSARRYLDAGELQKAVIEAKNALQKDPESGEVRYFLGEAYLRLGQGGAAEKEFRFARKAGVAPDRVLIPLAKAYLAQSNSGAVLDEIRALDSDPVDLQAQVHILRARAYLFKNKPDKAASELDAAASLVKDDVGIEIGRALLSIARRDNEQVARHVERALQLDPGNSDALALQAELLRQKGKLEEALQTYQKALKSNPYNREALLGSATVDVALHRLDDAEKTLKRLDEFAPGILHRQYLAAVIMFYRKDFDKVQELLVPIMRMAPGYQQAELLAGVTSYLKGENEAANAYLDNFLKAHPEHLAARKLLGMLKLKQGEPQGSVKVLQPAEQQGAKDPQYLALLGGAYLKMGKTDKAMQYLEQAAKLAPDAASIQSQLGLGYLALGESDKAVNRLESAVEMDPELSQADMLLVQIHLRNKEYDKALAVIRKMLDRQASNPLAYNLMAAAYLGQKEYAKARDALKKALQLDPTFRPAHINLARLDVRDGDLDSARRHYMAVLGLQTNHDDAYLGLAQLEDKAGNKEKAVEWLSKALDENPGALRPGVLLTMYYLRTDQPLKALSVARPLVGAHPDNPVALETLAAVQLANKDLKNAIGSYKKLAQLKPDLAAVQVRLGQLYMQDKSPDLARQAFERALDLESDKLEALVRLGALELEGGNREAARSYAKKILARHPKSPFGPQLMGDVDRAEKDFAAAAKAYGSAYRLQPSTQRALLTYQMRKASGDAKGALAILKERLAEQPNDAETHLVLANEYQISGQIPEAIAEYEKVRQLRPDNYVAWNNLAWLYYEKGNAQALEYARKANQLASLQPEVLDTYGWIELMQGDPEKGLKALQDAAVYGPHIPTIQYHLAVAQEKNGRVDAARKTLERLLKSGKKFPESAEAEKLLSRLGPGS